MNFNQRLEALQPYVTGIRFLGGMTLIDCLFKEGWLVKGSDIIQFAQNNTPNYFMFYSEDTSVTIDDLLDFVENIIKYNIEEENKAILLEQKIVELRGLFKENSLLDLKTLSFVYGVHDHGRPPAPVVPKEKPITQVKEEPVKQVASGDIKAVCKCKEGEQCSVCLGIDE